MCTRLSLFWQIAVNILQNFGIGRFVEGYLLDKYTLHVEDLFVKHKQLPIYK
jgi:hypothetical protein